MIRVGGGYATLEDHIRQVGPFECIKIYKLMKGNDQKKEKPMSYKEAVMFYLSKHKTPDRIVKQFLSTEDEESMRLFENAINILKDKQEQVKKKYENEQNARRNSALGSSIGGKGSPRGINAFGSPRGSITSSSPRGSVTGKGPRSPKIPSAKGTVAIPRAASPRSGGGQSLGGTKTAKSTIGSGRGSPRNL